MRRALRCIHVSELTCVCAEVMQGPCPGNQVRGSTSRRLRGLFDGVIVRRNCCVIPGCSKASAACGGLLIQQLRARTPAISVHGVRNARQFVAVSHCWDDATLLCFCWLLLCRPKCHTIEAIFPLRSDMNVGLPQATWVNARERAPVKTWTKKWKTCLRVCELNVGACVGSSTIICVHVGTRISLYYELQHTMLLMLNAMLEGAAQRFVCQACC
jgi:hypothetical protein